MVGCPPICFYSEPTFPCHSSLHSCYTCSPVPLPPPFPSPPLDGSKTHRRGLQANSSTSEQQYKQTAEENGWVPGAHEEEDSIQQTKDEPSSRYKQN